MEKATNYNIELEKSDKRKYNDNKSEHGKAAAIIGGVFLILYCVSAFLGGAYLSDMSGSVVIVIIHILAYYIIARFMFVRKKNIGLLVFSCLAALPNVLCLIPFFLYHVNWISPFRFFAMVFFVVLILVNVIGIKKKVIMTKIFGFIPSILFCIDIIMCCVQCIINKYYNYYGYDFWGCLRHIFGNIFEMFGFFFMGLWLIKSVNDAPRKSKNKKLEYNLGGAEKIKKYKELLDAGVITEEEFERKKKEALEL